MIKRGFDPYRISKLLDLDERAECIASCGDSLYIGTSQGNLVHVGVAQGEDSFAIAQQRGLVKLSPKKPIEQVCASGELVMAICDGVLVQLPRDVQGAQPRVLAKDVKTMCFHTGFEDEERLPEICISLKKKLALYSHNGKTFEQRQEFPTNEAALTVVWHQTWICAGFKKEYNLYSESTGVPREIRGGLDGKFIPRVAVASDSELLLLIAENIGMFYNLRTGEKASKRAVQWPRKVTALGSTANYAVGSTSPGQIDLFSFRDQKNS